jgi:hypothetical protein
VKNLISIPGTLAVTTILAGIVLVGGTKLVWPHSAIPTAAQPLGWQYGWECCNLMDCREIGASLIEETPEGYVYKVTGELIPYGDKKIKQSKDEYYHLCTKGGKDNTAIICLYTPVGAS